MNKQNLVDFLAWIQDNYTEMGDDTFDSLEDSTIVSRRDIVNNYFKEFPELEKQQIEE